MGATFVVALREAFEASLILGIVYSYLDRMGGRRYYGYVTLGAAVGFLSSLALGVTVTLLSGTGAGTWSNVLVGVAGIALAAGLGWAIFRGGRHVSLPRFFATTSVVLLLVAAGLFSTGVGRLQGIGWLPMSDPLWDTSHIMNDHGFLCPSLGRRTFPGAAMSFDAEQEYRLRITRADKLILTK